MNFKFDAFISYSRNDLGFARALQQALEHHVIAKPDARRGQRLCVFRDQSDLTASSYYNSIEDGLANSEKLIVICSPAARSSQYVNDEISRFLKSHHPHDVIPVLLEGDPISQPGVEGGNHYPFPQVLLDAVGIPAAADYRGFVGSARTIKKLPFRDAWFSILAEVLGISRRDVEQTEQQRARRRLVNALALSFSVIVGLSTALGFAIVSRRDAIEQRTIAENTSRSLIAADIVRRVTNSTDMPPGRSLLLAAQAAFMSPSTSGLGVLLTALQRSAPLHRILSLPESIRPTSTDEIKERIRSISIDQVGQHLAAITDRYWFVWDIESGKLRLHGELKSKLKTIIFAKPGFALLHGDAGEPLLQLNINSSLPPKPFLELPQSGTRHFAVDAKNGRVALITTEGTIELRDIDTKRLLGSYPERLPESAFVWFHPEGSTLNFSVNGSIQSLEIDSTGLHKIGRRLASLTTAQSQFLESLKLPLQTKNIAIQLGIEKTNDVLTLLEERSLKGSNRKANLITALSHSRSLLLTGSADGTVSIMNIDQAEQIGSWRKREYDGSDQEIFRATMAVSWSEDDQTFAAGFLDGEIWVWNFRTRLAALSTIPSKGNLFVLEGTEQLAVNHGKSYTPLDIDGTNVKILKPETWPYSVSQDSGIPSEIPGRVYVILAQHSTPLGVKIAERMLAPEGNTYHANHHDDPDGSRLFLLGGPYGMTPRTVGTGWHGIPWIVKISDDQSTIVVGFEDGSVKVIDVGHAEVVADLVSGAYNDIFRRATDIVLSNNGRTVYFVNGSPTLRKWTRQADGTYAEDFREFDTPLTTIRMSRDGQALFVGDKSGTILIIDALSLNALSDPIPMFGEEFHPKLKTLILVGSKLAAQADDGSIGILDLSLPRLQETACRRAGRNLKSSEIEKYSVGLRLELLNCVRKED